MKHGRVYSVGLLSLESSETVGQPKHKVMKWLQETNHVANSVVTLGFGTQVNFNRNQIKAIADALDASQCKFVLAVKVPLDKDDGDLSALGFPEEFTDRVPERGIVTTEWVPQKAILKHPAVGAFLTHAGWNSFVEGLFGGVVMLLWPMQADHYENAKILADELKVAIGVCEGLETVPQPAHLAAVLAESTRVDGYHDERISAVELGKKALDAIRENTGSSSRAIEELVQQV